MYFAKPDYLYAPGYIVVSRYLPEERAVAAFGVEQTLLRRQKSNEHRTTR
jgi:hypothetical protein